MVIRRTPRSWATFVALFVLLFLAGCLSHRYRAAPKETPPAIKLDFQGVSPEMAVLLH